MTEGRPVCSVINLCSFLELEWSSVDSNQATGLAIRGLIPGKSMEYFYFFETPSPNMGPIYPLPQRV
jgi:hypothetical protein